MKQNFGKALVHLFDAFEKLAKCGERTRRMFWAAVARLRMHVTLQTAAL